MTDCQDKEGLFTVKWHLAESAIHDVTLSLSWRSYPCLFFNLDCMGHYWHGATPNLLGSQPSFSRQRSHTPELPSASGANSNNPRNRSFRYTSKRAAWTYLCMTCGV